MARKMEQIRNQKLAAKLLQHNLTDPKKAIEKVCFLLHNQTPSKIEPASLANILRAPEGRVVSNATADGLCQLFNCTTTVLGIIAERDRPRAKYAKKQKKAVEKVEVPQAPAEMPVLRAPSIVKMVFPDGKTNVALYLGTVEGMAYCLTGGVGFRTDYATVEPVSDGRLKMDDVPEKINQVLWNISDLINAQSKILDQPKVEQATGTTSFETAGTMQDIVNKVAEADKLKAIKEQEQRLLEKQREADAKEELEWRSYMSKFENTSEFLFKMMSEHLLARDILLSVNLPLKGNKFGNLQFSMSPDGQLRYIWLSDMPAPIARCLKTAPGVLIKTKLCVSSLKPSKMARIALWHQPSYNDIRRLPLEVREALLVSMQKTASSVSVISGYGYLHRKD